MGSSRVLVTGGAGFIGSHLVDRLMKEGYDVVVLDNFFSGKMENLQEHLNSKRFHLGNGDVRSVKDLRKAIKDAAIVFHLAAIVDVPFSIKNPILTNDVNVKGTLTALEASLTENIEHFIYISTCAVYGEARYLPINEEHPTMPLSPYGVSKLSAENYCKVYNQIYGVKACCLRLFNVYGPRQSAGPYSGVIKQFVKRLKESKPPVIYGDGEQTRDFIHVNDVVDACMLLMEKVCCEGETFNIGTGKPTTISELANILIELSGKAGLKPVYKTQRKGDIRNSYADINKARRNLNFEPKIDLENGMKAYFNN